MEHKEKTSPSAFYLSQEIKTRQSVHVPQA
jgi:hypothetical protein